MPIKEQHLCLWSATIRIHLHLHDGSNTNVHDDEVRSLAGNSMCVGLLSCLVVLNLVFVDWGHCMEAERQPAKAPRFSEPTVLDVPPLSSCSPLSLAKVYLPGLSRGGVDSWSLRRSVNAIIPADLDARVAPSHQFDVNSASVQHQPTQTNISST